MNPNDLKQIKEDAIKKQFKSIDVGDIYDCPIHLQVGQIQSMMNKSIEDQVFKMVSEIGIEINRQGFIDAINQDRKRYEEAYRRGWEDCQSCYDDTLKAIAKLTGYSKEEDTTCKD